MSATCIGSLGGCALYSPTRDKQAQEAAQAWHDVDLDAQVAVPRKNMAALFAQQLSVEDELALAARDEKARVIATGATVHDALIQPVDDELGRLAGTFALADAWKKARADTLAARRQIVDAQRDLRRFDLEPPGCDILLGPDAGTLGAGWAANPDQRKVVDPAITAMTDACRLSTLHAADQATLGGDLAATRTRLRKAKLDLETRRAAGLVLRNNYRAAQVEYDAAAAALSPDPDAQQARLRALAGRLKRAADALAQLDDAFSIRFLSEQRRDALNATLAAIVDRPAGAAPPADANRATIALAVFPELLDKANVAFADAQKPTLVPLLLQKNLEQIRADAAARDVEAQQTTVAVLEQLLDTQSRQADRLLKARRELQGLAGTQVAAAALGPGSPPTPEKIRLWRAAAQYLDAVGRLSADAGKLDYRLHALAHERTLAYSESSILQWRTLIDSNVAQMVDFGASGIKAEHVTALLNSASLLAIAIGTNK